MIGLALVSGALVIGTSIKASFSSTLSTSITADWYVSASGGFVPFSPAATESLQELPELSAVTGGRAGQMQVEDSVKQVSAVDYAVVSDLFELDVQEGEVTADARGLLLHSDPAADLGVGAGDTVTALFQVTGEQELPVVAIYDDSSVLGNWVMDLGTYDENFVEASDFWAAAKTAEGFSPEAARSAMEAALVDYPEIELEDREEFQQSQEEFLDNFLLVINVFLGIAIIIAFIGIVMTLALSVSERTRELGLLRAVGETRAQVWGMITLEAVLVAVFGALLGVAIGLLFGLAVASALPSDFINTIDVPVGSLIIVVAIAAILGVVAALYPARKAGKLDVLDAISYE
jgi:putative ABC transport system permease protein